MKINITAKPNSSKKNKTGGWRTFVPETDFDKCTGCGTCARVCPENAIEMIDIFPIPTAGKKKNPKTDYDFCKGCGLCATECPVKAIMMELDKK